MASDFKTFTVRSFTAQLVIIVLFHPAPIATLEAICDYDFVQIMLEYIIKLHPRKPYGSLPLSLSLSLNQTESPKYTNIAANPIRT